MYNDFRELRQEARDHIIDELENGYEGYLCDFHNAAFNEDYYEVYTATAEEKLTRWGVFDAIEKVKDYEQDNFGVVNTDFSNPCKVINMLWYIIGEEELYKMFDDCAEFDELWNEETTQKESRMLAGWAKDNERV